MTYGTAIHALLDRGRMSDGETVLILGAAGGVGIAAIELAKAFGGRVVAGVSSEAKGAMAREAGADGVVVYPRAPFDKDASKALAGAFKDALGPNGADIVFDIVGGDYCEPALRSMAWQGRYLVVGFPAGIPAPPLNLALLKGCDICGVFWGAFAARDPKANAAHIATPVRPVGRRQDFAARHRNLCARTGRRCDRQARLARGGRQAGGDAVMR